MSNHFQVPKTQGILSQNQAMRYHVLPPYGLLNDPNGLVYYKGYNHVFFQWNPHNTNHSYKAWGHAITTDFIHYTYLEAALLPEESYETHGCYSGSAIVHQDTLYLFYTGNVKAEDGSRSSYQCLATSVDGFTFKKHGPVIGHIEGYTGHVRDPKVFMQDDVFYMILGAQKNDRSGDTLVFVSTDLYQWQQVGSLLSLPEVMGYMWECPDIIQHAFGDVFIFSPQGLNPMGMKFHNLHPTGYYIGTFNQGKFIPTTSEIEQLDHGFEFYAPQSFIDASNRIVLYGWMGVMKPEAELSLPTLIDGWSHHLSLPREISINSFGRLTQSPLQEIDQSFKVYDYHSTQTLDTEISLYSRVSVQTIHGVDQFELIIDGNVTLNYQNQVFSITRISWVDSLPEVRSAKLARPLSDIRMYLDGSSLEIFINEAESAFSLRFFPEQSQLTFTMTSSELVEITLAEFCE